ncbi:MAG: VOC family protein [Pseudomonadota bacterium]
MSITQFSYVVRDLDAAIEHFADTFGVGPFFVLEHVPYRVCRFRGEAADIDMSVAMTYVGDMQLELVVQHNDTPSIFTEFLDKRGEGLQHVGRLVDDIASELAAFAERGIQPVQDGEAENGTLFAYLDTDTIPGSMLELFQVPPDVASAFEYMKKKAAEYRPGVDQRRR